MYHRFLPLIIVTFEIWNYIVVVTYFLLSVDRQERSAPSPGMLPDPDPLGEEARSETIVRPSMVARGVYDRFLPRLLLGTKYGITSLL